MSSLGHALRSLAQELAELGEDGDRSRRSLHAALVVPLATVIALALQVDAVWWTGISGFVTTLATGSASLHKGLTRLGGTVLGALLAFIVARWLPYDHIALALFVGLATFISTVAMIVSGHGLAWLFAMVTVNLVLLSGLIDPLNLPGVAVDRVIEVAIGVGASALVTGVLAPRGEKTADSEPIGWRHLLGRDWPIALHGPRAAIAVIIVLEAWVSLDLPSMDQMAITIAAVIGNRLGKL